MPYKDPDDQRKFQREWLGKRRTEWFAGKTCANCSATDNLQLDHINPAYKVSHRIWSWAKEKREVELAKCQPLCGKCHREKTNRDFYPSKYQMRSSIIGNAPLC